MLSKKPLLIVMTFLCLTSTLHAYDTQGKFGMGINLWGTPMLLFSTLKYGISNSVGIEPSVGYHQFSVSSPIDVYNSMTGEYEPGDGTYKTVYNLLMLSGMLDLKPVQRERSNLLVRAGVSYWRASAAEKEDTGDPEFDYDHKSAISNVSIKAGLGVEHFFTDNFSVYAGFISLFSVFGSEQNDKKDDSFVSLTSVGNQVAELTFVWYL